MLENPSDSNVNRLLQLAQVSALKGQKIRARRLLWAALQQAPDQADLWIWLAGVASSPRASLGYLARALSLDPSNPQAHAGLRWARRQASEIRQPMPALPPARTVSTSSPSARPKPRLWAWATASLLLTLLITLLAAWVLFPELTALAAGQSPPSNPIAIIVSFSPSPASTDPALPTRTREMPPTWTPTSTATPSATPTETATPTVTPTPVPPSPTWVPTSLPIPVVPGSAGERWIDVNLSQQLLIAYEGNTPVRWISVSTGLPRTPTVVGQFRIYVKYLATDMSGDDYYLPNVPYTMYFYRGYGLHGTYWHSNFGYPMSHGCVNLPTPEAEWLFSFASVGTLVNIHY